MSITLKRKPIVYNYSLSGSNLNRVAVHKDLGIFIDSKLTFVDHTNHLIKKGNRMAGLVWRNFRLCRNEQVFRSIYCTLIRPMLEYCTVIFNSISKTQSDRLERVQGRYLFFMFRSLRNTEHLAHLPVNPTYTQLCEVFRLPTLQHRRTVNDCLYLYKHFHNRFSLTDVNPFSLNVPNRRTRSAPKHILHVPWSQVEASKRGFISRITKAYNRLHGECDVFGAPTLKCFRQQVNKAMSCNQ